MNEPRVEMGSKVRIGFQSGEIASYTIINNGYADPGHGIISCDAPLGKALLGKKKGDMATYSVGGHVFYAEIIEISAAD